MLRSTTPNSGEHEPQIAGTEIEALREQMTQVSGEIARISAARIEAAKRAAEAGAEYAREGVEEYPLSSLAMAFGAGALIGLAILPKRRTSFDWHNPSVQSVRNELADYTDKMKRSIRGSATGQGMISNFERVVDTVSNVDAKATIGPVWNRILAWLDAAKERASSAAVDLTKNK